MATIDIAPVQGDQKAMKLKILKQTNPKFDLLKLQKLHALYAGGNHLLENAQVMNQVFPKYSHEKDETYAERKRRAFYENVFAAVINQMSAGLAQDPVRYQHEDGDTPIDDYWIDLQKSCLSPKLPIRSLDQVLRDWVVEALVCGYSWLQADLPDPDDDELPTSLGEQEATGGLRAYLCQWATEAVLDWEFDDEGVLLWVKTCKGSRRALTPSADRNTTLTCWTIWDTEGWTTYEVETSPQKQAPNDEEMIAPKANGTHSFGKVPWVMLDVCGRQGKPSLHIGDMLESLCRAHFNLWNGEMFTLTQCNFQQLYEFLGPEVAGVDTPISDSQNDPNRANRTARAPGAVHVRGKDDRAEYVAPQMGGAAAAKQAVDDLRDAIYRVTQQMALSQDTSGAMLKRSADSKKQDAVAQEIVLGAIGKLLLSGAQEVGELLCAGRQDDEDPPEMAGYESFDVDDISGLVEDSAIVEQINIPSATFQQEFKYRLAVGLLGDATSEDIRLKIRDELAKALTQDQVMQPKMNPFDDQDPDQDEEPDPDDPNKDEEEQEGEDKKPPKPPFPFQKK